MTALRSRRVVTPEGVRPACVVIDGERIQSVAPHDSPPPTATLIEAGDKYVIPGLVDTHVHINEPGRTEWEGFATATRAAAAGGITTVVDMPLNNLPETTTVAALDQKRAAARGRCLVDYGFWGGVVADNQQHIAALAEAGVLGYKSFLVDPGIEGFSMVTPEQLEAAVPAVARTGLPLLVHAELPRPIEAAGMSLGSAADWTRYSTYLTSRPEAAEVEAIALLIRLCRRYGVRVHIVHLSAASALPEIRAARAEGLPITVETCPHYLHCSSEQIGDGETLWKCAPPIRNARNRELLWQALREGDIDLIASDHSPCPPEMKERGAGDFSQAWGGISSLELGLSIIWTGAVERGIGIERVVEWMARGPAGLAGMGGRKGKIAAGYDADLAVFDGDSEFMVDTGSLHHRHPITPYAGARLRGVVERTWLRGRQVGEEPAGVEFGS
ncbi:MAG: allantoinase AllB [Acidobacteriota bacterium]|nr:allantoinase AllB [Acidobacteriota bacterium]